MCSSFEPDLKRNHTLDLHKITTKSMLIHLDLILSKTYDPDDYHNLVHGFNFV